MRSLVLLILLFPLLSYTQDITGVWTGYVITSQKQLPYEVIISEDDGNLSGYSHITFYAGGKEMVAVKKLKIRNELGKWILEDDDIVYDNFKESQPRKMKQSSWLTLSTNDTVLTLAGNFTTNKTRDLKPASGEVYLYKTINRDTRLFAKLTELKLSSDLSFVKPKQDIAIAIVQRPVAPPVPEKIIAPEQPINPVIVGRKKEPESTPIQPLVVHVKRPALEIPDLVNTSLASLHPMWKQPKLIIIPEDVVIASIEKKPAASDKPATTTVVPNKSVAANKHAITKPVAAAARPVLNKPVVTASSRPATPSTTKVIASNTTMPPATPRKITEVIPQGSAVNISSRKIETIESVSFKTDSLVLTLYDNGEVDGDTVSVLMNGKIIVGKQGLTTNAYTKTIYITPDLPDSIQLIMYAENLGALPPNTGLLIIQDGTERHEIRFTGDLQKNAAILLRRRK